MHAFRPAVRSVVATLTLLAVSAAQDAPPPAATPHANAATSLPAGRAARRDACKNPKVPEAARKGIGWLVAHQDPDGRWDCDQFMKHDPPADPCPGPGSAQHDVGATGLALLAILAQGDTG